EVHLAGHHQEELGAVRMALPRRAVDVERVERGQPARPRNDAPDVRGKRRSRRERAPELRATRKDDGASLVLEEGVRACRVEGRRPAPHHTCWSKRIGFPSGSTTTKLAGPAVLSSASWANVTPRAFSAF